MKLCVLRSGGVFLRFGLRFSLRFGALLCVLAAEAPCFTTAKTLGKTTENNET